MSKHSHSEPKDSVGENPDKSAVTEPTTPPAPEPEKPAPVTVASRFRAEFMNVGSLRPLKWELATGTKFRIVSSHGFLCFNDGSQVAGSAEEIAEIAGLIQPIRPLDNIQIHTS